MAHHARLVIIGAGIVGASCAYHLTRLGWKDIVIVDKGELPYNDGSTSHAPGGVVYPGPGAVFLQLNRQSDIEDTGKLLIIFHLDTDDIRI